MILLILFLLLVKCVYKWERRHLLSTSTSKNNLCCIFSLEEWVNYIAPRITHAKKGKCVHACVFHRWKGWERDYGVALILVKERVSYQLWYLAAEFEWSFIPGNDKKSRYFFLERVTTRIRRFQRVRNGVRRKHIARTSELEQGHWATPSRCTAAPFPLRSGVDTCSAQFASLSQQKCKVSKVRTGCFYECVKSEKHNGRAAVPSASILNTRLPIRGMGWSFVRILTTREPGRDSIAYTWRGFFRHSRSRCTMSLSAEAVATQGGQNWDKLRSVENAKMKFTLHACVLF